MAVAESTTNDRSVSREDFVTGVVLHSGFRMADDGWLYPQGGEPLVRVCVHQGEYRMERRRTPQAVWMRIVTATVHEFDPDAFTHWAERWPLTA